MALIHSVKPLENPVLVGVGYSYTGVLDKEDDLIRAFRYANRDVAVFLVVLYGIAAKIVYHLVEYFS